MTFVNRSLFFSYETAVKVHHRTNHTTAEAMGAESYSRDYELTGGLIPVP